MFNSLFCQINLFFANGIIFICAKRKCLEEDHQKSEVTKEVWVRVVGLPLHLWSRELLKWIGDYSGGFIAVDEHICAMVLCL